MNPEIKTVCVYAASSDTLDGVYAEAARRLGVLLGQAGYSLVYGGGNNGLMGILAEAMHAQGGHITGVIPDKLHGLELAYAGCDELIVTHHLRERKSVMEARADAFIALPGGFGTLEEILEIVTLKQLGYHQKPVVFLNINGIYDRLMHFFNGLLEERFITQAHQRLYHVSASPEDALAFLASYRA
ncbi:MAG TPA: TIGR00730 family Rossman fold protein [Candidatus Hydrogenedentes bacterium]|nr:TIGR00730 family Rossman fold protein [Candidatus Hydrogenedentota bacterium]